MSHQSSRGSKRPYDDDRDYRRGSEYFRDPNAPDEAGDRYGSSSSRYPDDHRSSSRRYDHDRPRDRRRTRSRSPVRRRLNRDEAEEGEITAADYADSPPARRRSPPRGPPRDRDRDRRPTSAAPEPRQSPPKPAAPERAPEPEPEPDVSLTLGAPEEPDPQAVLAARRAQRQAILAKYAASPKPDASTSRAQTPLAADGSLTSLNSPAARLQLESTVGTPRSDRSDYSGPGSPAADDGAFDLVKDAADAAAVAASSRDAEDQDVSAADYNPDADRRADDERQLELRGHAVDVGATGATAAAAVEAEESEYEEVEVEDDEDMDDMFAEAKPKRTIRRKIVRNRDGDRTAAEPDVAPPADTAARPFVPIVNRGGDAAAGAGGLLVDNFDDDEGYYRVILGELLDDGRYHVHANLGKGMFSNVVRAVDQTDQHEVAIKIVRSQETMYKAGQKEATILRRLREADPDDKKHIVVMERTFEHRGHLCLVFESLSLNLREVVKRFGKDVGLNLKAVRAYTHQIFLALAHMRKLKIMHADLKPDNILVTESKVQLKVCDLGSASDEAENEITPYLVSRFYRAPEIILGLPYDCSLDTWSIGATLYELYTGKILFPGRTNNHMLLLIQELKGRLGNKSVKKSRFGELHFDETGNFLHLDRNKTTGAEAVRKVVLPAKPVSDLRARLMAPAITRNLSEAETKLLASFVDLLGRCLELDPAKRITPREALVHPFLR